MVRAFGVVVAGVASEGVFGLEDRVGDELTRMLVLQAVVDPGAFLAGGHQTAQTHFGQMLGDGGRRLMDQIGQLIDRLLTITQSKDNAYPCGVGEHRKNFHREFHELAVGLAPANDIICIHT